MSLPNPAPQPDPASHITTRAIIVGLILTLVICYFATDTTYRLRASRVSLGHMPMSLWLPFLLIFLINPLLKKIRDTWMLRPHELGLILCMGFIGSVFPTKNVAGRLIAVLASPYYKATPENRWAEFTHEHIQPWAVPSNRAGDITNLWEGLPAHLSTPYHVWAVPLFWWFTFFFALFIACLCITVILRKQWVEHERITFPLAQLPVLMIQDTASGQIGFLKNKLFWTGFGIGLFILSWNILPLFWHNLPIIPIGPTYRTAISFGHDFPPLQVKFNFVMAAFGYLTNLEVLLSIWLFHVLSLIEIGALNRFGITVGRDFGSGLLLQQVGGFIAFALFGLFMARQHIGTVIRALWQPNAEDKTELLSYRTAVIGLIIALIYASAYMYALGISLLGIAVQLGLLLIYFIGLAKIVAETGLVYVETPLRTQELAAAALGTNVQTPDHVGMALSANSVESHREYILPSLTHTAKIHDVFRWPRNRMVAALMLAFIIGFAVSIIYTLNLCYGATGAANIRHVFVFGGYSQRMFDRVVSWASEPTSFGRVEWQFLAAGALGTLFLSLMRLRFAWWPLHPVGFTVGYVYPVRVTAFTVFLVWAFKSIVLRIGGIRLYRDLQPFFIGLLIGYTLGVGLSTLVDHIYFPGNGHMVHSW
ncbi:MAG: hypothetical protein F4Y39_23005 [Gemmatimonadetes bacterium]|nr:hypothetical protein [Gemmatimonadota bacterium]MYF72835.1 hypothetical protein [Gemmatimonadota bacterium]MYK52550.1 hypothetical protein [Gemmatimonadota bacterium]